MKYLLLVALLLVGCGEFHAIQPLPTPPQAGPPGPTGPQGPPGTGVVDIYNAIYDGTVPTLCGQETFTSAPLLPTNILLQDGWSSSDNSHYFNEAVANVGSDACRGSGVWRVNTNDYSSGFGNQTSSPPMAQTAGESTLRSAGGGDTMETTFFFKTVATVGDGSAIEIDFSTPTANDRHNFMKIVNDNDPRGLYMYSTYTFAAPASYRIPRGVWNHVRMININRDGLNLNGTGNDIVRVYINGVLVIENSTYEQFRTAGEFCSPACPNYSYAVNRMMFRLATNPTTINAAFTSPQGFMFDDFKTKVYNRSNPSDVKASYQTGFEL